MPFGSFDGGYTHLSVVFHGSHISSVKYPAFQLSWRINGGEPE